MYLAYNSVAVEKLGKPAVMMVNRSFVHDAQTGVSVRGMPNLRLVPTILADLSGFVGTDTEKVKAVIQAGVSPVIDDIVAALTKPLTSEEKSPKPKAIEKFPGTIFKGNLEEVNRFFYKRGWSYGLPVIPPTEEAVREMLTGTDLPADHVVAKIPPRLGKATVEKIAINAVMAGALPTYMPVLIAAVQAMIDPKVKITGYSCSVASWAPLWIINGPIRNDLNVNSGVALMSPYYRANAAIGHTIGLITMNIGGVRPGLEDMAAFGHEGRFGMCIAENEEDSPWEPLHVEHGLNKEDSAVTGFWPNSRVILGGTMIGGVDAEGTLRNICRSARGSGGRSGSMLIMCPLSVQTLANEGWTKKEVVSHIVEYARIPAYTRYHARGSFEIFNPKELWPTDPMSSVRVFPSSEHVRIVVAGGTTNVGGIISYSGGGDYGGPVTKKIELPANWDKLVKKYKDIVPTYARY
jgi:hypothetical protein